MKNFIVLGHLWKRAIEFFNEAGADRYIAKNCANIEYEKCTEEEAFSHFEGKTRSLEYGLNEYNALRLIVPREA